MEPGLLPDNTNNYLASVVVQDEKAGIAYVDITTGEFAATEVSGTDLVSVLRAELIRLRPAETLYPESLTLPDVLPGHLTPWSDWHFELSRSQEALYDLFAVSTLDGFGLRGEPLAIRAAGAIIQYLKETQVTALNS